MIITSYSTNGRRKTRILFLALLLAASTAISSAQGNPQPNAKFNIQVAGEAVQVERWGKGPVGIVIFSHSGDLASELRTYNKALTSGSPTYFERTLGSNYSLFLWTYPRGLQSKVDAVLGSYFGSGRALPSPSYRGMSLSIVQQIRRATGLKKICLVGNSLGAGILLWDAPTLSEDKDVSMVIVAPTPLFLPPNRPSPGALKRTLVVVDATNDDYISGAKDKAYFRSLANGPYPPGYVPGKNKWEAHFIIGPGLEFVKSLVERTSGKPQVITFRNIPDQKVGGKAFKPIVSANSKLPVKLASSNPRAAQVDSAGRILPVGAGTAVIRATQAGNRQWMPAFPVERTLRIRARTN